MNIIYDHLGRKLTLHGPPKRIISLDPAITETLYHLGLEDCIVGRTRFCKYPEDKVKQAINIGGTKDVKLDRIHELKPDLIIAEKEENTKEIVEVLEQRYPVFVFEIQQIQDAYRMIHDLGNLTMRKVQAEIILNQIKLAFQTLPKLNKKRVAYVIWKKPYMVAGKNTYIQSLLEQMGFINPFTASDGRYPVVTKTDFQNAKLDYVFLATEPYPFKEKDFEEFQRMVPDASLVLMDGEMFWYGPKMLEAVDYFKDVFKNF